MKKAILLAAVAALLIAAIAFAQPKGMGQMADKLKPTDQQMEQFEKLKLQLERNLITLQADLKVAKLDLKEIMMQSSIDEKAALNKLDKISSVKANIAKMRLQHKIAASKILTDEQRAECKKMRHGMGGRGERGMDCKGPCCGMMGPGMMGPGMMGGGMMMGGPCKMGKGMDKEEMKEQQEDERDK